MAWIGVAAVVVAGCGRSRQADSQRKPPDGEEEQSSLPEHVRLSGGDFVLASPEGGRLWQGKGESFEWDTRAQIAVLKQAEGTFFEGGKPALRGSAPSIRVDYKARVVRLEQGVRAESAVTGAAFSADRLEWRAAEQKVYGQGNVKLVRGQSEARGDRMVADTALRRVRLEGKPAVLRIVQSAGKRLW